MTEYSKIKPLAFVSVKSQSSDVSVMPLAWICGAFIVSITLTRSAGGVKIPRVFPGSKVNPSSDLTNHCKVLIALVETSNKLIPSFMRSSIVFGASSLILSMYSTPVVSEEVPFGGTNE